MVPNQMGLRRQTKGRQMRTRNKLSRVAASLGAAALGIGGLLVGNLAANATPEYGNINGDTKGSITIHKYMTQNNDDKGNVSDGSGTDNFEDPVAGVVFTAYPLGHGEGANFVPLDLTVPGNWNGLKDITPTVGCGAPAGYTLGEGKVFQATSNSGVAKLEDLGVGAYVVCETSHSGATVGGHAVTITKVAEPFIATIPTPYEKGWIYGIHAFPKNLGFTPVIKNIDEQKPNGLVMGATVRYRIRIDIPPTEGGEPWTTGAVTDVLDPRLAPVAGGIESVKVLDSEGAVLKTFASTGTPKEYDVVAQMGGNGVAVVFTSTGLGEFSDNKYADDTLEVVVTAKVTSLDAEGQTSGVIKNQAGVWTKPDEAFDAATSDWSNAPVKSDDVTTRWGQLKVFKHADNDVETKLAGAEFELYDSNEPYPADGECGTNATGQPLEVGGGTTLTSDSDGVVSITGLFVSDSQNATVNAEARCYVLVETKAPAGYLLPTNSAFAVKITPGTVTSGYDLKIPNTQQKVPGLPVTGAAGRVLLAVAAVGGSLLLVGLLLVNKRRQTRSV